MSTPTVIAKDLTFLEGPRWRADRLWVSDFYSGRVLAIAPDGQVETIVTLDGQPSGLGWLPDGRMLVVSMLDKRVLRLEGDVLVEHADISHLATSHANDMLVDEDGRAWVGNFGFDLVEGSTPCGATLARIEPDGTVTAAAHDLQFPNGMVRIGDELVVAETMGQRLTAFTIGSDGTLSDRRVWADLTPSLALPDGICADSEGAIWIADAGQRRVMRIAEGGEVLQIITVDSGTYACALGGPDRRTLYICAAPTHASADLSDRTDAMLLAVRVEVPGA